MKSALRAPANRLNGLSRLLFRHLWPQLAADLLNFLSHLFFLAQALLKQANALFLAQQMGFLQQTPIGSDFVMLGLGRAANYTTLGNLPNQRFWHAPYVPAG